MVDRSNKLDDALARLRVLKRIGPCLKRWLLTFEEMVALKELFLRNVKNQMDMLLSLSMYSLLSLSLAKIGFLARCELFQWRTPYSQNWVAKSNFLLLVERKHRTMFSPVLVEIKVLGCTVDRLSSYLTMSVPFWLSFQNQFLNKTWTLFLLACAVCQ